MVTRPRYERAGLVARAADHALLDRLESVDSREGLPSISTDPDARRDAPPPTTPPSSPN